MGKNTKYRDNELATQKSRYLRLVEEAPGVTDEEVLRATGLNEAQLLALRTNSEISRDRLELLRNINLITPEAKKGIQALSRGENLRREICIPS